jgi:hypothetical protein
MSAEYTTDHLLFPGIRRHDTKNREKPLRLWPHEGLFPQRVVPIYEGGSKEESSL